MRKLLSQRPFGSSASSGATEPKMKIFLRMISPYPGDNFSGIVQLHLPFDSEVLLVEVVLVGKESARIGVLSGSANFEIRKTTYYQQYITVLGAVPPAVMESRRKAATTAKKSVGLKPEEVKRGSLNKQASLRAINARSADGEGDDGSDQNTVLYAPTTVNDDQIVRLTAGTYTFPFTVKLPDVMPPSGSIVRGKEGMCQLQYRAKARVLMRNGKQLNSEAAFTVRMLPVQLQRWLQLHRPLHASKRFPVEPLAPGAVASRGRTSDSTSRDRQHNAADDMPSTLVTGQDDEGDNEGYDLHFADLNTDEAASSQRRKEKKGATDDDGDEDSSEYEKTQRRCIDHRACFSSRQLDREEAEYIAAAEKAAAREKRKAGKSQSSKQRESEGSSRSSSSQSSNSNDSDGSGAAAPQRHGDDDKVFTMDNTDQAAKPGTTKTSKKSSTKATRMRASEVEKLGFAPAGDDMKKEPSSGSGGTDSGRKGNDKSDAEQDEVEEQRRRMHHHRNSTKPESDDHQEAGDPKTEPEATATKVTSSQATPAAERGVEEADVGSVRPPSCTVREPVWEQHFIMPLRCGLVSKGTVGLELILQSNVLCPGSDRVKFSAIIDNTQGGAAITKVRYSLVVRQMIRSRSETYPFSRVEAESTQTHTVQKGKIARMPPIAMLVPSTTPYTVFTDGGYSSTFLNIRLYASTALKTYSRSAEIELLIVSDVDEQNKSRRLLRWTNYFVGHGIPANGESGPTLDFNETNLHPKVIEADAVAAAEDEAAAETAESLAEDRYTASVVGGATVRPDASVRDGSAPSQVSVQHSVRKTPFSASSTALLLAKHTRMAATSSHGDNKKSEGPQFGARTRRLLNYEEATYLPLALSGGSTGAGGTVFADPMAGVNPLTAPRQGRDLDAYAANED